MNTKTARSISRILGFAGALLLASCATANIAAGGSGMLAASAPQQAGKGILLSAEPFYLRSAATMGSALRLASPALLSAKIETGMLMAAGYADWRKASLRNMEPVQAIKLRFALPGENGEVQSGMIFLPAAKKSAGRRLSWVVYCKGTEIPRNTVPSNGKGMETGIAASLAALGNAVWMPDYEGMGDSLGIQTYCVPSRLSASALGGLAAARAYLNTSKDKFTETGRLYIMGYSEGGLASMAAAKDAVAEEDATPGLSLSAIYPMGAPLNLMIGMDSLGELDPILGRPEYQVLLVLGWARAYPDIVRPAEILVEPLLSRVAPLFQEGILDNEELHAAIARVLGKKQGTLRFSDVFLPGYLEAMRRTPESVPYFRVQRENRLDQWMPPPGLPVFLAASESDTTVQPANSHHALSWMKAHGDVSQVTLIRLLSKTHAMAGGEALLWAVMDIDKREKTGSIGS